MAKVITIKQKEGEGERAREYVRRHILFPAGLLGMFSIVIGVLALLYQLIMGTYDVSTFAQSSGLIVVGMIVGWGQSKYHKYILREHPECFASRLKLGGQRSVHRMKKQAGEVELNHPGRSVVPWGYVLGMASLFGLSGWSVSTGSLDYMAAFTLPWSGFFWGKLFAWRGIIDPPRRSKKK